MVADHDLAGIQALPVGGTICGIDDQCVEGADIATAQLVLLKIDLLSEAFGEFDHDSTSSVSAFPSSYPPVIITFILRLLVDDPASE